MNLVVILEIGLVGGFLVEKTISAVESVLKSLEAREEAIRQSKALDLQLHNEEVKLNDTSYLVHLENAVGLRQKVLAREGNLCVVQFRNADQLISNQLKNA